MPQSHEQDKFLSTLRRSGPQTTKRLPGIPTWMLSPLAELGNSLGGMLSNDQEIHIVIANGHLSARIQKEDTRTERADEEGQD